MSQRIKRESENKKTGWNQYDHAKMQTHQISKVKRNWKHYSLRSTNKFEIEKNKTITFESKTKAVWSEREKSHPVLLRKRKHDESYSDYDPKYYYDPLPSYLYNNVQTKFTKIECRSAKEKKHNLESKDTNGKKIHEHADEHQIEVLKLKNIEELIKPRSNFRDKIMEDMRIRETFQESSDNEESEDIGNLLKNKQRT